MPQIHRTSQKIFELGRPFLQIEIKPLKYLNNIVEQDHRFIKKITKPMKGFKAFNAAQATLAGIESHQILRKGRHKRSVNAAIFEAFYRLAAQLHPETI